MLLSLRGTGIEYEVRLNCSLLSVEFHGYVTGINPALALPPDTWDDVPRISRCFDKRERQILDVVTGESE